MDTIRSLLDMLDIANYLPDLTMFSVGAKLVLWLLMLVGPVLMLLLGLMYYTKPPAEANFSWGFRTYFGMGSKAAWDYAQRLAGMIWSALGAFMGAAMLIMCVIFIGKNPAQIAFMALVCMIVQASLTVLSWAAVTIMVTVNYDKQGQLRK